MREFSKFHPFVNLIYFVLVIAFSMFFMHPVSLAVSLFCAVGYVAILGGKKALKFELFYMIPLILFTAILNPLFNHRGVSIIAYFPNGNPLTSESILFGVATACMLAAVVCWFWCVSRIFTSDKIIFLFGKILPSLSLVISMSIRFVPEFISRFGEVRRAQKSVGKDISDGKGLAKIKNGASIISIVLTWSLENAVQTADSMKCRGYGLKKRTAYSDYRFSRRDFLTLTFILINAFIVISGYFSGSLKFWYFPTFSAFEIKNFYDFLVFFAYFMLCITPFAIEITEDLRWKALKSKI